MLKEAWGLSAGWNIVLEAVGHIKKQQTARPMWKLVLLVLMQALLLAFQVLFCIARRDLIVGIILKDHVAFCEPGFLTLNPSEEAII